MSQKTSIIRNKRSIIIPSISIVPGDVILIRSGDRIPADIVLFHCTDLKLDNSSITGESEQQTRFSCKGSFQNQKLNRNFQLDESVDETYPLDAKCLAFSGMIVLSGEAYGIVIRTGESTIFAKIASLSKREKTKRSPLSNEIRRFCKILSFMAICIASLLFVLAWARSQHFNYSLQFAVGILVGWIPQGLPITVTILLAIAGRKMSQRNVLVKDLHGVETLGAITMLCTDKTGTLTQNVMSVSHIWTNMGVYFAGEDMKGIGKDEKAMKLDQSGVAQMLHVAAVCTRYSICFRFMIHEKS